MNAKPLLVRIAEGLKKTKLEAVLIGNAAAALNGAPVTTLDFDFMVRDTRAALGKIRVLADCLDASVVPPKTALSNVHSVVAEDDDLFIDFLDTVVGVKSFASLLSRAVEVAFGDAVILVASLEDILESKRAANRPKDKASVELIETTLAEIASRNESRE